MLAAAAMAVMLAACSAGETATGGTALTGTSPNPKAPPAETPTPKPTPGTGLCARSESLQESVLEALGKTYCWEATPEDLAGITELSVRQPDLTAGELSGMDLRALASLEIREVGTPFPKSSSARFHG